MKKFFFLIISIITFCFVNPLNVFAQTNLIKNPGFEKYWGGACSPTSGMVFSFNFDTLLQYQNNCGVKDWIELSGSPDAIRLGASFPYGFPVNDRAKYIYPHSDSAAIGEAFLYDTLKDFREMIEGKLIQPLIGQHRYKFSMYVQLFDTIYWSDVGRIVGINNFDAFFSNDSIPYSYPFSITNYTPQVRIKQMVTDTQHWVLLTDTFIAAGGERFVSIGNFKTDSLTQYVLVDSEANLPRVAYYFIDDVSLIDLDAPNGINELKAENGMRLYPNPTINRLTISLNNSTIKFIEITDIIGQLKFTTAAIPPFQGGKGDVFTVNTTNLPNGIYFLKATDDKGFSHTAKFVKE